MCLYIYIDTYILYVHIYMYLDKECCCFFISFAVLRRRDVADVVDVVDGFQMCW